VAVPKHPAVLQEIKERKICIELNPLSNTQLGYGRDLRCHPGWTFLSHGVPCSISPDDPGIFLNYGGAFDWLWCVICWDLNLAHIKKLCLNSIHGAGNPEDTLRAWEEKWNTFIAELGADTA
jgi:adenosine deaminase CECR1